MDDIKYHPIEPLYTSENFIEAYFAEDLERAEYVLCWMRGLAAHEALINGQSTDEVDERFDAILKGLKDKKGLLRRWVKEHLENLL